MPYRSRTNRDAHPALLSTTVTQKVSSSSAKVPRHPSDWEYLIVERDSIVVPVPWLNASRVKFISVNPPISRNVADIARSAQFINVNASRLFDRSSTVCAASWRNGERLRLTMHAAGRVVDRGFEAPGS